MSQMRCALSIPRIANYKFNKNKHAMEGICERNYITNGSYTISR